jgi:TRAP-type C4-dicarboxylate transport system permease small subunit
MKRTIPGVAAWIQRRSENLIATLLGVMFVAFMLQIVFRYFFGLPTGWSTELSLLCWLWMVLWGAAFALKEKDEIRLDLLLGLVGARTRRALAAGVALATVVLYGMSLPAATRYVAFMKVERSSYLDIRLDWLYSVFVIFTVAIVLRYLWLLLEAVRGTADEDAGGGAGP